MSAIEDSGIFVVESARPGQSIATGGETIAGFAGPAARGPANTAVQIYDAKHFRKVFGVQGRPSRLESLVGDYFANGGRAAWVVRVAGNSRSNRVRLAAPGHPMVLEAINPGPLEAIRVSVDFDGIDTAEVGRFNLVIQRCAEPGSSIIEAQESWRGLSVSPADEEFLGRVLLRSSLVKLHTVPVARPDATVTAAGTAGGWVNGEYGWSDSSAPTDYDLIGSTTDGTGIHALDSIPRLDLLHVLPGRPDQTLGPVALFAAQRYAKRRRAMILVDPQPGWGPHGVGTADLQSLGLDGPHVMNWYADTPESPGPAGFAGAIAGALAEEDREPAWHVPGTPLQTRFRSTGVGELEASAQAGFHRHGVNTCAVDAMGRLQIVGMVTGAQEAGSWGSSRDVRGMRRLLAVIKGIENGVAWASAAERTPATWALVRDQVSEFLEDLRQKGWLAGERASESWYVKCDPDTNHDCEGLRLVIGVAVLRPGVFESLGFSIAAGRSRFERQGWQPGLALAS